MRRVATLRPSLQPRGSEESRLLGEIHERVELQHEITFSRGMGVTVGLLGLLCNVFLTNDLFAKLKTALS